MIGRVIARMRRQPTALASALPPDDSMADASPVDRAAWDALLGPDQPIPPLGMLPPHAQPDCVATMRLVTRLRQACGLEGGR